MPAEPRAATKVFGVTELLEAVLLEVGKDDVRTVLLAQRVDRTFRATIQNSKPLQEALFFRVKPTTNARPSLNPLFLPYSTAHKLIISCVLRPAPGHSTNVITFQSSEILTALPVKSSCRRMLLAQPTLDGERTVWEVRCMEMTVNGGRVGRARVGELNGAEGPTLGDVVKLVKSRAEGGWPVGEAGRQVEEDQEVDRRTQRRRARRAAMYQ